MENKKLLVVLLLAVVSLSLAGCWDETEIEDIGFLSAVAIDLAEEQGERPIFEVTEQFVVPAGISTLSNSGNDKAYRNLTQTGEAIFEINTDISRKGSRKINIEHLELILISEELAREEDLFSNVIDVFIRQQFMRRGIHIAITDGKAKDLLEIAPGHVKLPAQYISELLDNHQTLITVDLLKLGDVQEKLLMNNSFKLPFLTIFSENSVNYEGVIIYQEETHQAVAVLEDNEIKGMNFIIDGDLRGALSTSVNGEMASFNITEGDSKYKLTNKNQDELKFIVDIEITTDLMEYFGTEDFYQPEVLKEFETDLADEIKRLAEVALNKIQKELKVDVLDFDTYLRTRHNKLWEEIKEDWDQGENYFSQSDITINVKATITEPGTSVRVNAMED